MRWLVEVSSLGKTDLQKFVVDAESWQRALQAARAQRGEEGPMSGFSIELLEEGYRAVDPLARVRFVVKRAPDDMALTAPAKKDEKKDAKEAKEGKSNAVGPAPTSSAAAPTDPKMTPPPAPSSSQSMKKVGGVPRPGGSVPPPASTKTPAKEPAAADKKGQTMTFGSKGEAAIADATDKHPVAERPPAPAVGSQIPGLPTVKLLSSREQEPSEASPLTYREYAFAVPEGTSDDAATDVLRAQLRLVEAHIANATKGRLVNLAVFDVEFVGKPPRPPIATLTWKDWKGEPVLAFPKKAGVQAKAPRPPDGVPPSLVPQQTKSGQMAAASQPASVPPPSAQPAPAPPPAPAQPPAPAPAPVAQPAPPAPQTAPMVVPAPNFPVPQQAQPPVQVTEAKRPASTPPPGMVKTPSGKFVRGRVTGDELITSLFESMHDLHFLRDALDGGQFCLALATEVLPARAALIHFFDVERREWVVACTRGKETGRLLNSRTPESDELLREAARKRRALVVGNAQNATSERYKHLGGSRSLIVAPIMQAGRALGALEIINPLDGMPFTEDEGNAMTYIAEQYAEYLGSRGIVLDRDRIQSAAAAR